MLLFLPVFLLSRSRGFITAVIFLHCCCSPNRLSFTLLLTLITPEFPTEWTLFVSVFADEGPAEGEGGRRHTQYQIILFIRRPIANILISRYFATRK